MNTIYINRRLWGMMLILFFWLPIKGLAQSKTFEMVVEKTDGSILAFKITNKYPIIQYHYEYDGAESWVNMLEIKSEKGNITLPCSKIKQLYTREFKVIPGDITENGSVDVQDATITVNYILGNSSDEYDYTKVDMNNDGEIDVFDVTAIINAILNGSSSQAPTRRSVQQEELSESISLTSDENGLLFNIDNANRFTSFQFDLEVPQGVSLLGADWNGKTNHMLQYAKNGENHYRVVALSMESKSLPVFDGALIRLNLSGTTGGEIYFSNVLFVNPQGQATYFNGHTVSMTTGINGISFRQGELIYDISGRQLNKKREQLDKGVYIINHKKVVIK